MHACMKTYIHMYMHTYIHTYMHTHTASVQMQTNLARCVRDALGAAAAGPPTPYLPRSVTFARSGGLGLAVPGIARFPAADMRLPT